eukprot:4092655-Pleurochrysis_carterae.AAC.4
MHSSVGACNWTGTAPKKIPLTYNCELGVVAIRCCMPPQSVDGGGLSSTCFFHTMQLSFISSSSAIPWRFSQSTIGWFEAEDSNTLRLKFKSVYDFGQYPTAVVFDKADLLGGNALPLYSWMTKSLVNPWGLERVTLNYEKFLLDADGRPVRRYPRKYPPQNIQTDVEMLLAGKPLPPMTPALEQAWQEAKREAVKSEYAFRAGLNYYAFGSPAS